MAGYMQAWTLALHRATASTIVTDALCNPLTLDMGVSVIRNEAKSRIVDGYAGRFILIGNGGSLAIASHIATDFALVGWPSVALTDAVALTSHTNDYGSDVNFTKQLELFNLSTRDILVAMSCSGRSPNIIDAAKFARASHSAVITLSGFEPDNELRRLGSVNFYVPAFEYGFVQLAHASILHAACDIENGWGP